MKNFLEHGSILHRTAEFGPLEMDRTMFQPAEILFNVAAVLVSGSAYLVLCVFAGILVFATFGFISVAVTLSVSIGLAWVARIPPAISSERSGRTGSNDDTEKGACR